ncbi:MAG TPA: hypothetical protein VFU63_00020, partial [Ktedonobacterales bacterium]|nr:hypothetical protein [Ktedonobacterales bacterium]
NFVTTLGTAGWFMPYLLLAIFFTLGGVLLAGIVAQMMGWNKSLRTVHVIREAHDAAAILHRNQTWGPASNSIPSVGGYWNSVLPSAGPVSHPGSLSSASTPSPGPRPPSHAPVSATHASYVKPAQDAPLEQQSVYLAPLPPFDFEAPAPIPPAPAAPPPSAPEPIPPRRGNSDVQPVQFALTDDLRSALDRWQKNEEPVAETKSEADTDSDSDAQKKPSAVKKSPKARTPAKHQSKASAYLNSEPPATPRRSRKKQNTRDWLC